MREKKYKGAMLRDFQPPFLFGKKKLYLVKKQKCFPEIFDFANIFVKFRRLRNLRLLAKDSGRGHQR